MTKFIQIQTVAGKDGSHVLYALDELGDVWAYEGAQRVWLACGTERMEPRASPEQRAHQQARSAAPLLTSHEPLGAHRV
jgi:hypothetical protein